MDESWSTGQEGHSISFLASFKSTKSTTGCTGRYTSAWCTLSSAVANYDPKVTITRSHVQRHQPPGPWPSSPVCRRREVVLWINPTTITHSPTYYNNQVVGLCSAHSPYRPTGPQEVNNLLSSVYLHLGGWHGTVPWSWVPPTSAVARLQFILAFFLSLGAFLVYRSVRSPPCDLLFLRRFHSPLCCPYVSSSVPCRLSCCDFPPGARALYLEFEGSPESPAPLVSGLPSSFLVVAQVGTRNHIMVARATPTRALTTSVPTRRWGLGHRREGEGQTCCCSC